MKSIRSQIQVIRQLKAALSIMLLFLLAESSVLAGDIDNRAAGAYEMLGALTSEEISAAGNLSVAANTLFSFSIPQNEYVRFTVYDTKGKEIAVLINDFKRAGDFSADLNKAKLTKGTYYYRLVVGKYREIRRLDIIK
ncbi:MAG TPA: T9SS type A sorting domain-containing protein [Ignavibacteria bacterium]|nr:T9SS type A sorting domain-containing protein [Ignavibacteria bacterium]